MTVSGTTAFNPYVSDLVIDAFERLGIGLSGEAEGRPANITDLMLSARMSCNLVMGRFAIRGVNLWKVDSTPTVFDLSEGQTTITLPSDCVAMLDTFRRVVVGSDNIDVLMYPLSRNDYAAIPDKAMPGLPTTYWFNRQVVPQALIWPPPDQNGPYQLVTYLMHQMDDAIPTGGQTLDLPYRALYAFVAALAYDLSIKWARPLAAGLKAEADLAWQEFSDDDREKVSLFLTPDFSSYFR